MAFIISSPGSTDKTRNYKHLDGLLKGCST